MELKMAETKSRKFRGVRQRHWGSWVSEIRHPLLKKRVWLGTFDTAEEAARVYDQAAVIMCGRNAKTNFPIPQAALDENHRHYDHPPAGGSHRGDPGKKPGRSSSERLSQVLHAKLKKSAKTPSPSLTCLRLDTETSLIGVWQKRAGPASDSRWVMTVKLGKTNPNEVNINGELEGPTGSSSKGDCSRNDGMAVGEELGGGGDSGCRDRMEEEERIALQMIEELLNRNCCPASPSMEDVADIERIYMSQI